METLNLEPAAREVISLLDGVANEQLAAPTPCEDTSAGRPRRAPSTSTRSGASNYRSGSSTWPKPGVRPMHGRG